MRKRKGGYTSLREIVFGLEDSLVSTLGTVTGIAIGSQNIQVILLSGIVLVVVEAISMSAGTYLSTKSEYELKGISSRAYSPIRASMVMFVFYLLGGCIPIIPYLIFSGNTAIYIAIVLAMCALFILGIWKGIVVGRSPIKSALEMVSISFIAVLAGYIIGLLVPYFITQYYVSAI